MDDIFESRRDIETLMLILQEWQESHTRDSKFSYSEELFNKLDYLHMVW